jgi:hypothetical protein
MNSRSKAGCLRNLAGFGDKRINDLNKSLHHARGTKGFQIREGRYRKPRPPLRAYPIPFVLRRARAFSKRAPSCSTRRISSCAI